MITEFTIPRDKWLRGNMGTSYLLRGNDRKQCCVGLYLSACGLPDSQLLSVALAHDLGDGIKIPEWLRSGKRAGGSLDGLYNINDGYYANETEREILVADRFKRLGGVTVNFVDTLEAG